MEDKKMNKSLSRESIHNIIMENREKMSVSGVLEVESFDEETIILHTEQGVLIVKGEDLHINKLNIESGELIIDGIIDSLTYTDQDGTRSKGMSFFSKIFR